MYFVSIPGSLCFITLRLFRCSNCLPPKVLENENPHQEVEDVQLGLQDSAPITVLICRVIRIEVHVHHVDDNTEHHHLKTRHHDCKSDAAKLRSVLQTQGISSTGICLLFKSI